MPIHGQLPGRRDEARRREIVDAEHDRDATLPVASARQRLTARAARRDSRFMPRADFRFALPHRVRYAEVDSQAIVFYGNYLTFLDNALTDYIRQFGFVPGDHVR